MSSFVRAPCDEAQALSAGGASPCGRAAAPWVLAATILGSSMAFIDGTVVNVVLPALQRELHATMVDAQWVVEAYMLCLAALLLVGGSLGDRFGRRRVFVAGVALFAAASAACGLAGGIRMLVAARAVQGVGAALLVPESLAILSASFSGEERGRAIGTWSGFTAITTALGPVAGGWLIDHLSWRWAFFVNVPLAAAVVSISLWRVPESRGDSKGKIDWAGALLATAGLAGLVYGLVESSELGWESARVVAALAAGAVSLALFVVRERRARDPMVPPRLFRSSSFTGANLLTFLLYAALAALFFFVPLDMIQVRGYTATAAGAAALPVILLLFLLSRFSGGLAHRLGSKPLLVAGPALAAAGFVLFIPPGAGGTYWTAFFPGMAVLGLALAATVAPLTTTVMSSVDSRHAGIASGINNAVSRAAGVLAVAILTAVMLRTYERRLEARLSDARVRPALSAAVLSQTTRLAAVQPPADASREERALLSGAVSEAFVAGFRRVMAICAGLSLLASAAALALVGGGEKKKRSRPAST